MSQIFCDQCRRMLAAGAPRVVITVARALGSQQVYICGDCEYRNHMKEQK